MKPRYFFALFVAVSLTTFLSARSISSLGASSTCKNAASRSFSNYDMRVAALTIIYDTVRVEICARGTYSGHGFNIGTLRTQNAGDTIALSRYITGANNVDTQLTIVAAIIPNPYPVIMGPDSVCQGVSGVLVAAGAQRYIWDNGDTASSIHVYFAGKYSVTGINHNGCVAKSTHTFAVKDPIIHEETRHLCNGDTTYFHNEALYTSCRRDRWDLTPQGCDSQTVVYVEVTNVPVVQIAGNPNICNNLSTRLTATGADNYLWSNGATSNTVDITTADTISVVGTTRFGCSSSDTIVTYSRPVYDINLYDTICLGESVSFYRRELRGTGSTTVTDHSIYMCDSVVTMHVQVNEQTFYEFTRYATNSYTWNDSTLTAWGDYKMVFTGSNGCDSTATLHLGIIYNKPRPTLLTQNQRLLLVDHFPGGGDSMRVIYNNYRWYRNGVMIQYGGDAYHLANYQQLQGCYWVEVLCDSVNWMPSEMVCIDDVYDNIDNLPQLEASIAPKPVAPATTFTITLSGVDNQPASLFIYDACGRQVSHNTFSGTQLQATSPATAGLYTIRLLVANGSVAVSRLIVR